MSAQDVLNMIKDNDAKYVDFRFTDTRGKEHHVTVPAYTVEEDTFKMCIRDSTIVLQPGGQP